MLKLSTLIALFICFVYSNNEHNVETQLPLSEQEIPTEQGEENKNTFHTLRGHYIEEKKSNKPCKENKNRRHGDEDNRDADLFDSLPLTATTEQMNTASIGNKIITSSIHGANYHYKNENTDMETDNSHLPSKNCDCDDCILEANKKVLQFESMAVDANINPFHNAEIDTKINDIESADSYSIPFNNGVLDETEQDDRTYSRLDNVPSKTNTVERTRPCNKRLNINTRRRKCGIIDKLESFSNTPTTRRILPGTIENPTEQELEDNKLFQDSPEFDHKMEMETEMESRQNYFPNVHKVSNSYGIDLVNNMNINEAAQQPTPVENALEGQLSEPTKGRGIYDMKEAAVMLLENSRVCYACSTISDPTCWNPDRRTTVKYCRKGHQSCLTKSFKHNRKSVIIRDCGSYCVNLPNSEENYNSCSVCHSDLCNSASSMGIYTTGFGIILFLGLIINKQ